MGGMGHCLGDKSCRGDCSQAKSVKDIKKNMLDQEVNYLLSCWIFSPRLVFPIVCTAVGYLLCMITCLGSFLHRMKILLCTDSYMPGLYGSQPTLRSQGNFFTSWGNHPMDFIFRWFWRAARSAALGPLELMQTPPVPMLSSKFRSRIQLRGHLAGELEICKELHCLPLPNVTLKYVLSTTGHSATVEFFVNIRDTE